VFVGSGSGVFVGSGVLVAVGSEVFVAVGSGIGVLVGIIGSTIGTSAAGTAWPAPIPTNKRAVGTQPAKASIAITNKANNQSFRLRKRRRVDNFMPFCETARLVQPFIQAIWHCLDECR
jgi:hypothetical protein